MILLSLAFLFAYLCLFSFVLGLLPIEWEERARLIGLKGESALSAPKKKRGLLAFTAIIAFINKPFTKGPLRKRLIHELMIAHVDISPEEFLLIKEILLIVILLVFFPFVKPQIVTAWLLISFVCAYIFPEMWLKGRIQRVKNIIIRELPNAIDLLTLCVNAGLDFMLALKWVVEKSPRSVMVDELSGILHEINIGKPRRDAIRDMSERYQLPDLSTFARTLIQADKMGTSVTEALNILSEDMRISRFRRGEKIALKAPLKMLVPLLLFIFPVVGILVAGPILIDFIEHNPFDSMKGK